MTDIMFTRTALTEAAKEAEVTTAQARTILEAAGVNVQPEKPALPTEPGSAIIATEVRGETGEWRMFCDSDGDWFSTEPIGERQWHAPKHITKWTEVVMVPVTAAPVALTEDQVGGLWDQGRGHGGTQLTWETLTPRWTSHVTATVNATLAQYATHADGEPIYLSDVEAGDLVRVEQDNGDEATITVKRVAPDFLTSERYVFYAREIRTIHLLHREEA